MKLSAPVEVVADNQRIILEIRFFGAEVLSGILDRLGESVATDGEPDATPGLLRIEYANASQFNASLDDLLTDF